MSESEKRLRELLGERYDPTVGNLAIGINLMLNLRDLPDTPDVRKALAVMQHTLDQMAHYEEKGTPIPASEIAYKLRKMTEGRLGRYMDVELPQTGAQDVSSKAG